jgi:LysM repeat protein
MVVFKPFIIIGRFLFRWVGFPIYRLLFFLKRQFSRFYIPAKNKFVFLFANRLVIHVVLVGIVIVVGASSVQASTVRDESLGLNSLFSKLINPNDTQVLEEISATEAIVNLGESNYEQLFVISSSIVDDYREENQVAAVLGSGAIITPTISQSDVGVAPRAEIETYIVQDGDVLSSISEKFGLKLNTLLWANNLSLRSTIKPGQELVILPTDGITYKVKSGDTISSIVKKYGSSEEKVLSFNNFSKDKDLQIGQTLILPDAAPITTPSTRYTAPVKQIFTGQSSAAAPSSSGWVWPTDGGSITVYFGQWYIYGRHIGLDIDGDYTSNIYAARAGRVTRAGWFDGYGNCIDIDHGDGYVTRYGHSSKLFVVVGDSVSAGQVIAKVGTTGKSTGTHLHFEVFYNGARVNPLNFIRYK